LADVGPIDGVMFSGASPNILRPEAAISAISDGVSARSLRRKTRRGELPWLARQGMHPATSAGRFRILVSTHRQHIYIRTRCIAARRNLQVLKRLRISVDIDPQSVAETIRRP